MNHLQSHFIIIRLKSVETRKISLHIFPYTFLTLKPLVHTQMCFYKFIMKVFQKFFTSLFYAHFVMLNVCQMIFNLVFKQSSMNLNGTSEKFILLVIEVVAAVYCCFVSSLRCKSYVFLSS